MARGAPFRLTDAQGIVVKEGRRELRDQLYLTGAAYQDSDRLRYDKQLLGNWLRGGNSARADRAPPPRPPAAQTRIAVLVGDDPPPVHLLLVDPAGAVEGLADEGRVHSGS